jgi:hypothetical protein
MKKGCGFDRRSLLYFVEERKSPVARHVSYCGFFSGLGLLLPAFVVLVGGAPWSL